MGAVSLVRALPIIELQVAIHVPLQLVQALIQRLAKRCPAFLSTRAGVDAAEQESRCGLIIERVRLPADEKARI